MPYFYVDIETTGLDRRRDKITELAFAIEGAGIPPISRNFTNPKSIRSDLLSALHEINIRPLRIVEYSTRFDSGFIKRLLGIDFSAWFSSRPVDVLKKAREKLPGGSHCLLSTARRLGIPVDESKLHHAEYDKNLLIEISKKLRCT